MKRIAVFGGTTEGRHIAEFCNDNKILCSYFAATVEGKNEVIDCRNIEVLQGRLDKEEMKSVFTKNMFSEIIDATHPYAVEVSLNIKEACKDIGTAYTRVIRDEEECSENDGIVYADNIDEVVEYLNLREDNILITTGSKDAESYTRVRNFKNRVFLRVLPNNDAVKKLTDFGFLKDHIITGKGPFSLDENIKAINNTNSSIIVTKESGKTGGYNEKIKAANICGCEIFCIKRPKENGISEQEIIKRLIDMKKTNVYIIGIGMGNTEFLSDEAKKTINRAGVVIGAERMIASCDKIISDKAEIFISYDTIKIAEKINDNQNMSVVVLMSGDTGFFSGAKRLMEKLKGNAEIISGISSMSYLASRIGISWEDAYAVSMHGRKENLPFAVLTHEKTFVLTDGKINQILTLLREYNLSNVTVYIGKNLSLTDEKVIKVSPNNYTYTEENCGLVSLFIINTKSENRMRFIKDNELIRNETPMTKEAVRGQIISRFDVKDDAIIYDIGSGTGSVSLMLARLVPNGRVYAFDISQKAMEALEKNKRKFSTDHIEGILGTAPQIIEQSNIPSPDAVFVGGSKGNIKDILVLFEGSNIPFVTTAITTETYCEIIRLINEGIIKSAEITQFLLTESVDLGRYHIMSPHNPVWIISGIL